MAIWLLRSTSRWKHVSFHDVAKFPEDNGPRTWVVSRAEDEVRHFLWSLEQHTFTPSSFVKEPESFLLKQFAAHRSAVGLQQPKDNWNNSVGKMWPFPHFSVYLANLVGCFLYLVHPKQYIYSILFCVVKWIMLNIVRDLIVQVDTNLVPFFWTLIFVAGITY